jgi:hypothetical protein
MGEMRYAYKVLVVKPEGKRNLKIDPKGIGYEDLDSIHMAQNEVCWRDLVNAVMNLRVP